ncbi:MAG: hypothetical protein AB7P04_01670 [Bacteriovoracia bacterium]
MKRTWMICHLATALVVSAGAARTQAHDETKEKEEHAAWQQEHEKWEAEHAAWEKEHQRAQAAVRRFQSLTQGHGKALRKHDAEIRRHAKFIREHETALAAGQGSEKGEKQRDQRHAKDQAEHDRFRESHAASSKRHAEYMGVIEQIERLNQAPVDSHAE